MSGKYREARPFLFTSTSVILSFLLITVVPLLLPPTFTPSSQRLCRKAKETFDFFHSAHCFISYIGLSICFKQSQFFGSFIFPHFLNYRIQICLIMKYQCRFIGKICILPFVSWLRVSFLHRQQDVSEWEGDWGNLWQSESSVSPCPCSGPPEEMPPGPDLASLCSSASGRAALGQEWLCSPSWPSMSIETLHDNRWNWGHQASLDSTVVSSLFA